MLFSKILLFPICLLFLTVLADNKTIINAIERIKGATEELGSAVEEYDGGFVKLAVLGFKSFIVGHNIESGTRKTNASPDFDDGLALSIYMAGLELRKTVNETLDTFVGNRPKFGLISRPLTHRGLVDQRKLSSELGKALVDKTPDASKDMAEDLNREIDAAFVDAIYAYRPGS